VVLAAAVVVLLTIRRAAGPGPLARALAEYAVVAVLAVLLATAGGAGDVDQQRPAPAAGNAASTAPDTRPGPIKAVTGAWDWLADLWRQASAEADRRARRASTTTPEPKGEAMAPLPTPSTSTRRPL
jgi:hypothetical protein